MLDINITTLIQLVNFLVALVVLNALLIAPIRHILKLRQQKVNGLLSSAEGFAQSAAQRIAAYEEALSEARREASVLREQAKAEGGNRTQDALLQASGDAQLALERAQNATRAEAETARHALQSQVEGMASRIVGKILG